MRGSSVVRLVKTDAAGRGRKGATTIANVIRNNIANVIQFDITNAIKNNITDLVPIDADVAMNGFDNASVVSLVNMAMTSIVARIKISSSAFTFARIASALAMLLLMFGSGTSANASTVFALVDTGELFASEDQGVSWQARSALPVSDAAGLIAGSSPQELFLISETGTVYLSVDAGLSWVANGLVPASDVIDLAGQTDGSLLVLTRSGVLWISDDGGTTFAAQGAYPASNHVSLEADASSLFVLTATGEVAESVDDGLSWVTVGAIPVPDAVALRAAGSDLYVLTATGLSWRSMDNGVSWQTVGTVSQVGMSGLTSIAEELVAVSQEGLVARSSDGSVWSWVGTVNQLHVVAVANDTPQTSGVSEGSPVQLRATLKPPAPNPLPAGGTLQVAFTLPVGDTVALQLLDGTGRVVARREPEFLPREGSYRVEWTLSSLASGVYFLNLTGRTGVGASRRVTVLR